ncbi:hypothetical protein BC937DRAFT_87399 [Endogone sp. FLAS-F59071]|nr:hypothetical protein BC937DRAFT_87399 [Endogone sp. FLAS-F59071]|eukprot:RUS19479.1 hypothetical protein BC937DRAFT_87399 [Endogone sp. FLAS-F59071]
MCAHNYFVCNPCDQVTNQLKSIPPKRTISSRQEAERLVGLFTRNIEEAMATKTTDMKLWHRVERNFERFCRTIKKSCPQIPTQEKKADSTHVAWGTIPVQDKSTIPVQDKSTISPIITHEKVGILIKQNRGRQMEGIIPYNAFRAIIKEYQSSWERPALQCLEHVAEELLCHLNEEIKSIFGAYPSLASTVSTTTRLLHERLLTETMNCLKQIIIPMETQLPPFTWDTENFNISRSKFRVTHEKWFNENSGLLIRPADDSCEVMAMAYAYMKVSHTRFIDTVPQLIDLLFLHGLTKELRKTLVEQLGLVDPNKKVDLDTLMVEDKYLKSKRDRLLAKQECLLKSLEELERIDS